MNPTQRVQRAEVLGHRLANLQARSPEGLVQTWRAGKIDDATRPNENPALRQFIIGQNLRKAGAPQNPDNLDAMTRFNTLHHIISKDQLGQKLAPALVRGWNHQDAEIRTAARAFLDEVKVTADFHEDILGQDGVQEAQFRKLLQNMPLNFELGFEAPIGNPGTEFDPQVVKGDTAGGISDYTIDPMSEKLQELDQKIKTLADNPSAADWTRMTQILVEAGAIYQERPKLDQEQYLIRPDLRQWDAFGEEAQKKTPGRYIDDVAVAFGAAGNPYANTPNLPDLGNIPEDWEYDADDLDETVTADFGGDEPAEYHFLGIHFEVKLRHIAARHTMRFFQFEPTATNTFFPGVSTRAELEQTVRDIVGQIILPQVRASIQTAQIADGDWPEAPNRGVFEGVYLDYSLGTETENEDDQEVERVTVKIATMAPQAGAIHITKPKVDAFVAAKQG